MPLASLGKYSLVPENSIFFRKNSNIWPKFFFLNFSKFCFWVTCLSSNPPRICAFNVECSYGHNFTQILNLIFFLHFYWLTWFFEYPKSKKYKLEIFFFFGQKKFFWVILGNFSQNIIFIQSTVSPMATIWTKY